MNIVYLITGLGMGGAERIVVDLADAADKEGHDVTIVLLTGPILVKPKSTRIKLIHLDMKSKLDFIKAYYKLTKIVRDIAPDVIHSHMVHANIIARLIRLITPIKKLVCTAHNTIEGGRLRTWAYRATDYLADISTNVSEEATRGYISSGAAPSHKMVTIVNGIDTNRFSFNPAARQHLRQELNLMASHILLSIGRLYAQKDYPNILHAAAIVRSHIDDFVLLIAGEGPLDNELRQLARQLDLENHVQFLGLRSDIPDLLSSCDAFVLGSAWEGMPLVLGEAMACERLVVATDCGGVKELIGDLDELVPPQNPTMLAQKIVRLLQLPQDIKSQYQKSHRDRIVKHFSLKAMYENYMRLYQQQ